MNVVSALTTLSELLSLITTVSKHATEITALINKARSEGRDITDAELDGLKGMDDLAKQALDDAIKAAGG